MRVLRYLALLGILLFPAASSSHAQVRIGIGVGIGGPVYAPPVCPYGYYGYAPYACAPYGYYGPSWFPNGVFIGAGPWYHRAWGPRPYYGYRGWGYGHPGYYYYRHDDDDRGYWRHHHDWDDDDDQGGWHHHGDWDHDGYRHDNGEHRGWYKHDR